MPALGVQPFARVETTFDQTCQRHVHIIAPKQQMLADSDPFQAELILALCDRHQTEISRPPTNVTHQNNVTCLELRLP